jgi:hypothetical protein
MTAPLPSPAPPAFDPPATAAPATAAAGQVALQTLTALAGGLCADAGLRVLPSEGGWACAIDRREIYVPVSDLTTLGLPTCAGVLAHECGHALITRRAVSAALAAPLAAQLAEKLGPKVAHRVEDAVGRFAHTLSNALEDGRCEAFMADRYPGCAPWLRAATLTLRGDALAGRLYLHQLLLMMADLRLTGPSAAEAGVAVDDEVAAQLRRWWPTIDRYRSARPDADLQRALGAEGASGGAGPAGPGRSAAVVEQTAAAAGAIAAELAPALIDLLLADARWLAGFGPPPRQLGALLGAARDLPSPDQPSTEDDLVCAIQLILKAVSPPPVGPSGLPVEAPPGWARGPDAVGHAAAPPIAQHDPRALAAALAQTLARSLRAARPGRRAPLRSLGTRPHLPAVLRREADPRASDQVWFAKPPPERRWAAVSLLVDLSGSMRGEKVEAAKLGAEACALALSALGVPFALQGFQDVLIPLLPFGAHRPAAILQATTALEQEVRGDRPQGNNRPENNDDGPCLHEAAAALARRAEPERLLVVISDGQPEGSRSTPEDLHAAVRRWTGPRSPLRVVAIGLGPRTEHVADFYPDAIAGIQPEALPRALAEALQRRLRRAG